MAPTDFACDRGGARRPIVNRTDSIRVAFEVGRM
jgi:hypothetical protein